MKKLSILAALSLSLLFTKPSFSEDSVFHNSDPYIWFSNDRAPTATEPDVASNIVTSWFPPYVDNSNLDEWKLKGGTNGSYIWDVYITQRNFSRFIPAQLQSDWNQANPAALDFVKNKPSILAKTINNNVSRSLNSNYTISTTRDALASYSINVSWTLAALLSGNATAYLEYSINSGSTWITVNQVSKTLSLLTTGGADDLNLSGVIPANALVRIRTTSSNMTPSYTRGQETLF